MKAKQRKLFTKQQFDDQQAYEQIKDEIRKIRERNLKQVEEQIQISKLYDDKKKQLKRKKMEQMEATRKLDNKNAEASSDNRANQKLQLRHELGEEDEEEGQINQARGNNRDSKALDRIDQEDIEQVPSIRNLGQHIRPITLTRNKVCDLLMSRKFQDIVKGCFVRYKTETSSGNNNQYLLAQVLGVIQSSKQYYLNQSTRTRKFLKLQQSSQQVIPLSIEHLSNQHPQGSLQISAWIRTNRNKIPKQKQLRQKLEQLNNLMYGKVSSEQIDQNIFAESVAIAEGKIQAKGDLSKYIYFMEGQLHDINVSIDEQQSKQQSSKKAQFQQKYRQKTQFQEIISSLKKKKAEIVAEKMNQRKKQAEKSKNQLKKYSQIFFEDRKEDRINDKVKQRILMMSSHEGSTKIRKQIEKAHQQSSFQIQL